MNPGFDHAPRQGGPAVPHGATPTNPAVAWIYQGLWGVLTGLLRVPRDPPRLPHEPGDTEHLTLRPSPRYLTYLKLGWAIIAAVLSLAWLSVSIILFASEPLAGLIVCPLLAITLALPLFISFLSLHLRFDTTWYLLSDRSMRIRRGAWVVHETSITYENIQQVAVSQGPLQRFLGISIVVVTTAGGGSGLPGHGGGMGAHLGLLEGLEDAERIRELVLARQRASRTAGLGDEAHDGGHDHHAPSPRARPLLDARHVEALREIRSILKSQKDPA
ncbi:MAG: PH domain-containing protein [Phycisphaerales bacterium]